MRGIDYPALNLFTAGMFCLLGLTQATRDDPSVWPLFSAAALFWGLSMSRKVFPPGELAE